MYYYWMKKYHASKRSSTTNVNFGSSLFKLAGLRQKRSKKIWVQILRRLRTWLSNMFSQHIWMKNSKKGMQKYSLNRTNSTWWISSLWPIIIFSPQQINSYTSMKTLWHAVYQGEIISTGTSIFNTKRRRWRNSLAKLRLVMTKTKAKHPLPKPLLPRNLP